MVAYEQEEHVAILTIDRPEARNAISPDVARAMEVALDRAEGDAEVRACVIGGTPPVFCAGADLKAIAAGRVAELSTERGGFAGVVRRERVVPLIAAVDGPAFGGGAEIVLACDAVVASTAASLGLPEVKRGLIAAAGGLFRLARKLPENVALELVMTGDPLTAKEAYRHGLVNRLCEPGEARSTAVELARRIAANAPLAVRSSRAVICETTGADHALGWSRTDEELERLLASEDAREGVRAFAEKRAPVWAGR